MSFFKKIGRFFSKPKVQKAVVSAAQVVASGTTVGKVMNLAVDLGALDFVAKMVGRSIEKVSGFDDAVSIKIMQFAAKAVVDTQLEAEAGKLTSSEQKRQFAQEKFKFFMVNDEELKNHPNIINVAPMLIELVYQAGKVKVLLDQKNRDEVARMMMDIGSRAVLDKSFDPVKEFFTQLDLLAERQSK